MLCAACRKIFDCSLKRLYAILYESYVHHESAHEIEVAGKAGCYICSTLWDRLAEDEKELICSNATNKAQSVLFLQILRHVLEAALRVLFWFFWLIMRYFMKPEAKQFYMLNDYCCYGWKALIEDGVVVFTFGSMTWKLVNFMLLPCRGQFST